jgi:hypothetical protein
MQRSRVAAPFKVSMQRNYHRGCAVLKSHRQFSIRTGNVQVNNPRSLVQALSFVIETGFCIYRL